ncbi:MAG TPA: RtcB family protein, partial [Actinomycetota bacterium]|nr:RtcB family protein [Actinomycetota bacterium]
ELCLDTEGAVWILLHSGSRGIGNQLAQVHMARAKRLAHNADLPDPDLAVFLSGTPEMAAYRHDLDWAQEYARHNRLAMLDLIRDTVRTVLGRPVGASLTVHCHHNYVALEHHFGEDVLLTRKGAIRAGRGELGIVPGSMGAPSFVVRGLGNQNAFESAPHGAGRAMSRNAARRRFTRDDLATAMRGIEARTDAGVLDEHPGAYKDVRKVIEQSRNLVEVVAELRQVAVVKG